MKIEKINISLIKPNPWNPNKMSDRTYKHLVKEFKRVGYLQPILVRKKENFYEIIDGEHRFLAAKEVGLKEIECVVLDNLPDEEAKILTINMNKIKGVEDPILLNELIDNLKEKIDFDYLKEVLDLDEFEEYENELLDNLEFEELDKKEKKVKKIICPNCGYEFEL